VSLAARGTEHVGMSSELMAPGHRHHISIRSLYTLFKGTPKSTASKICILALINSARCALARASPRPRRCIREATAAVPLRPSAGPWSAADALDVRKQLYERMPAHSFAERSCFAAR
jgi:hypothetical protein